MFANRSAIVALGWVCRWCNFRRDTGGVVHFRRDTGGVVHFRRDTGGVVHFRRDTGGVVHFRRDTGGVVHFRRDTGGVVHFRRDTGGVVHLLGMRLTAGWHVANSNGSHSHKMSLLPTKLTVNRNSISMQL